MPDKPWQDLEWRLPVAAVSGCAAVFVAAVLVTRLGTAPLPPWWTLAAALVVGCLASLCVELLQTQDSAPARRTGKILGAILASGVTSIAVLATTKQAAAGHLAFACTLCLLFSTTAIAWAFGRIGSPGASTATDSLHSSRSSDAKTIPLTTGPLEDVLPDHVQQTLSRYLADGRDHLEACVRIRFEPGQQSAIVHLPIQPAMQGVPDVECEPVGEEELRITVDPAQPYGVRLLCRRPAQSKEAGEAIVSVLISADRTARAAA